MKSSQYNQVPSVGHPNVHGTFVTKNFTVTHFNRFTYHNIQCSPRSLIQYCSITYVESFHEIKVSEFKAYRWRRPSVYGAE